MTDNMEIQPEDVVETVDTRELDVPDVAGLRTAARLFERLSLGAAYGGSFLILGITVLISINALLRKSFQMSITGSLELVEYSLVWITFLSAAWVLRHDGHVKVDLLIMFLNRTARRSLWHVTNALGGMTTAFLFFYSGSAVWSSYVRGVRLIQQLVLPKWIVLIVIPIGFFMLTLEFLLLILRGPHEQFLEEELL